GNENQFPFIRLQFLARAEKDPQTRGAQIVESAHIQDQCLGLTLDQTRALLFQFWSGFCIQTASESQELGVTEISLDNVHSWVYCNPRTLVKRLSVTSKRKRNSAGAGEARNSFR